MLFVFFQVEAERLVERLHLTIDPHAGKTFFFKPLEELFVFTFAPTNERCDHKRALLGKVFQQPVDDFRRRLFFDDAPADRAVRRSGAGEEQPQVVVNFGNGSDRRTGVVTRRFLVDADRRA